MNVLTSVAGRPSLMSPVLPLFLGLSILFAAGCASEGEAPPTGGLPPPDEPGDVVGTTTYASSCKRERLVPSTASRAATQDCIEFEYDGQGILVVRHINTAFNCCPDSLFAEISVDQGRILIQEREVLVQPCNCLCLFDLHFRIEGLKTGSYEIMVEQLYLESESEPHHFSVDLQGPVSGSDCIVRDEYPWRVGE